MNKASMYSLLALALLMLGCSQSDSESNPLLSAWSELDAEEKGLVPVADDCSPWSQL
jgi:hypothetical protein